MDVTAIRNDSNNKGLIFQEILPHARSKVRNKYRFVTQKKFQLITSLKTHGKEKLDTKSANAVQIGKKLNKESDALSAVKLDPAVLEAQITITRKGNNERPTSLPILKNNKDAESERRLEFERAMYMQRAAIMSLSGEQFSLLMRYVDTLRVQRQAAQKQLECAFCKNNGQPEVWYTTHGLKDGKGRVLCPALRVLQCRRCGATGDHAHTIKYCPTK